MILRSKLSKNIKNKSGDQHGLMISLGFVFCKNQLNNVMCDQKKNQYDILKYTSDVYV